MNYEVGDQVFIHIRPSKSTIQFGKGTKLSPLFIGLFKVLEKFGRIAYHLTLQPHLHKFHNIFHVSVLKHYTDNKSHILQWKELQVLDEGTISIKPLCILEHKI